MQPGAHGADRHVERDRDLPVAEVGERVEEQSIPLPLAHLQKCACQPSAEREAVKSCGRVVLVIRPHVHAAAAVGAQPAPLRPPAAAQQVRRDPVQPGQVAVWRPAARALLEGDCERLGAQLIGDVASGSSMEVAVDSREMSVEDRLERGRLRQRAREVRTVRWNEFHHPACARGPRFGFGLSIALDLAPTLAPGRIVGIDVDPGQIEASRNSAAERAIDNAEFVTASVYELPFENATFDVVYANAVLLYLREPVRALAEMRRVLRPGGLAAASDDDLGTVVITPERPELRLAPRLFECAVAHEGGNARYSRHLRTLMLEAGFARTQGVAHAPEVYGDETSTRWFAEFAVGLFGAPSMTEVIIGEGWASRAELDAMLAAFREWAELPDAFAAWLYCGALGWTT